MAQNPSDKSWFEADAIIACAPFDINITNLGVRPGNLFVDFEGDPNDPYSTSGFSDLFAAGETIGYTYNTPGTYLIRVVDQSGGGNVEDRFDFLTIQVIEPIEPEFTVSLCAGNEVSLNFNFGADQYDFYEIDFGDGQGVTNLSKNGSSELSYTYAAQGNYSILVTGKLNLGNDINCGAAPPVDISTLEIIPIPSIDRLVTESENSLTIAYQSLDPSITYALEINSGSGFQTFTSIDPNQNPDSFLIQDNSLDNTQTSYSFRIKASDPCNSNEEFSSQVSSIVLNYELNNITNSINIDYSWTTNELITPMAFYQNGIIAFETADLTNGIQVPYNVCNELTPFYMEKAIGSTIVRSLTITPFENQNLDLPAPQDPSGVLVDNNIELDFQSPPFPFSQIEVFRKNGSGNFGSIGTTNTLEFTDFGVSGSLSEACYIIRYIDECGNESFESGETCIPLEGLLRTPNAFSPNGDGVNDTFNIGNGVFTNFQLLIFNKWGGLVYKGNDPTNGWDGNIGNQEAPTGTYLFKISYLKNGLELISTGTVTLIR